MALIKAIPNLRPRDIAATARTLAPLAPEMVPGAQVVASKFMRRLAGKTLARLADNVMPEVCPRATGARKMPFDSVGILFFVDGAFGFLLC